jgi:hypothetical protein
MTAAEAGEIRAVIAEVRDVMYLALRAAEDDDFVTCADHLDEAVEKVEAAALRIAPAGDAA